MKTIFIFIDDISHSGGTERVASFLANQLLLAGNKIVLVSLTLKRNKPYYPLLSGIKLEVIGKSSIIGVMLYLYRKRCDVIISVSMGRLSLKIASIHSVLRLNSRLILSEHVAFEIAPRLVRLLKWLSYQVADELVLLTQHDYELLHRNVRARTSVISNASSFDVLPYTELQNKQKIVLAVGRLTRQKAFDRLIRIWASLKNTDGWILRIVGDGEEHTKLQNLITTFELTGRVQLIPATETISVEYYNASILAMTSRYEGLPLVLIEAKSYGLPAIAFDCKTGPREIIHNNVDGILVPNDDETEFAMQLTMLMQDGNLRSRMQLAALASSNDYTIAHISQKWQELI